jgi:hypothetical protein
MGYMLVAIAAILWGLTVGLAWVASKDRSLLVHGGITPLYLGIAAAAFSVGAFLVLYNRSLKNG